MKSELTGDTFDAAYQKAKEDEEKNNKTLHY